MLSINSSHDSLSENAESKQISVNKYQDTKCSWGHVDNTSCIIKASEANLALVSILECWKLPCLSQTFSRQKIDTIQWKQWKQIQGHPQKLHRFKQPVLFPCNRLIFNFLHNINHSDISSKQANIKQYQIEDTESQAKFLPAGCHFRMILSCVLPNRYQDIETDTSTNNNTEWRKHRK